MAAEALEQSVLESKDKEQLLAIAKALGLKASARTKKSDIIGQILETTGAATRANGDAAEPAEPASGNGRSGTDTTERATADQPEATTDTAPAEQPAQAKGEPAAAEPAAAEPAAAEPTTTATPAQLPLEETAAASETTDAGKDAAPSAPAATAEAPAPATPEPVLDENGEPLAEWELALRETGEDTSAPPAAEAAAPATAEKPQPAEARATPPGEGGQPAQPQQEGESRNRRRRRRRKGNRGVDGPQGDDVLEAHEQQEVPAQELVPVSGYLDMRDEGYGFLRVRGYLPSREDAYIPVKLARQYGLRKGDHVTGVCRPAGRNEKNPALLEVHTVNGGDPEAARHRPRFEELTALFPDERLRLEDPRDPMNMTARIIDLVAPIGKGQRGLIVSPPKAGKTTVMKTIAKSIEANNPEVKLIVLLIDERPEEVTDMRRSVRGEVIASTFDRPSDEHTHVAELVIEKAKRMVEMGEDVVIILDGITRLARAYNLAAPASGRILSGGIDAGALYPPKKFFGAARNVEEGGSLTILATALVDTNSRMDEAIFEEFKGTGNMELRLDRKLAERRIFPAIDVDASSTRHEELLFDRKQLQLVWKLRRVLSGLAADGNAAPGLELLIDRLKTFRTNDEFLNEIAKQPSM